MIRTLAVKTTTKEAWEAIKSIHVGSECAHKSTLQRLRRDWELLSFHDGEDITEQRAFEKLLCIVPRQYKWRSQSTPCLIQRTSQLKR
jgi:hypothetical protein